MRSPYVRDPATCRHYSRKPLAVGSISVDPLVAPRPGRVTSGPPAKPRTSKQWKRLSYFVVPLFLGM